MADLYTLRADLLKALAHPLRVQIIDRLHAREACVCQLVEEMGVRQSTVSKHLAILREAGVLTSRKEGLLVFYTLRTPCLVRLFSCIDHTLHEEAHRTKSILEGGKDHDSCSGEVCRQNPVVAEP